MTALAVLDHEVFEEIREDYRTHSFEFLLGKYGLEQEILKKVLGAHDLEEFEKWVDGAKIL